MSDQETHKHTIEVYGPPGDDCAACRNKGKGVEIYATVEPEILIPFPGPAERYITDQGLEITGAEEQA